jgi:hypothetical protein
MNSNIYLARDITMKVRSRGKLDSSSPVPVDLLVLIPQASRRLAMAEVEPDLFRPPSDCRTGLAAEVEPDLFRPPSDCRTGLAAAAEPDLFRLLPR